MIKSSFRKDFDSLILRFCLSFFRANLDARVPPYAAPCRSLYLYFSLRCLFFSASVGASISIRLRLKTLSNLSLSRSSVPCAFNCLSDGANSSSSWKSVFFILYLKRPTTTGFKTMPSFSCRSFSSYSILLRSNSAFACFLVSFSSWRIRVCKMST